MLKQQGDGDLVVLGSGALVRDLAAADLVDRYLLSTLGARGVHPAAENRARDLAGRGHWA